MTPWDRYERWNSAVADVIFAPEMAGIPVYLDLEEDEIEAIGAIAEPDANDPMQALVDAVLAVLHISTRGVGTFEEINRATREWWRTARQATTAGKRAAAVDPPPVLALLAVFSVAAERMGQDDAYAAHNYYNRLYDVLNVTDAQQRNKLQHDFMQHSELFWAALNTWLGAHDGNRGLPTAFALSKRFIGLPMSQALLRAADRRRLPQMFNEYGLPPGYQISPSDMERLLDGWIIRNPPPVTAATRRLWDKGEPRERIAAAAAVELAAWDGTLPGATDTGSVATGMVRLIALVRGFPRKQLELGLLVHMPGVTGSTALRLTSADGASPDVEFAHAGGWLRLARADLIEPASLVGGVLRLQAENGMEATRRPRRLVPLRWDEAQSIFVEAERVQLGEDSLLLARDDILDKVVALLEAVARPGFAIIRNDLPGLPPGWAAIRDVQVLGAVPLDGMLVDLNVLLPLATTQLTVADGLLLPGAMRKWSSLQAPEIRGSTQRHGGLRMTVEAEAGEAAARALRTWESDTGALIVPLAEERLPDGDYVVTLYERAADEPIQQARVRLRSGDWIDDASWSRAPSLAHRLDAAPLEVLSASEGATGALTVRGALAEGAVADQITAPGKVDARPWWSPEGRSTEAEGQKITLSAPEPRSCMVTGAHLMRIETVTKQTKGGTVTGVCAHCGLVKRYPTVFRRTARGRQVAVPPVMFVDVQAVAPVLERVDTWESAVDGLFHLGGGPVTQLERLALQVEASSLFVDTFLRSLEVLGHIEVERDSLLLRPVRWEVAPSVIAELATGDMALAGCWSASVRQQLADAVRDAGGKFDTASADRGPVRWLVRGLSREDARRIAVELDVAFAPSAASKILDVLPPLSSVLEALPKTQRPGARRLQRFDVAGASWVRVEDCQAPGAYRFQSFDTLDGFRTASDVDAGIVRIGTVQLTKHLAALQQGRPLVAYEPRARCLMVPLGADLPGLYGRAAVLCSGRLPEELQKQRALVYRNVPPEIAATIIGLLSS